MRACSAGERARAQGFVDVVAPPPHRPCRPVAPHACRQPAAEGRI